MAGSGLLACSMALLALLPVAAVAVLACLLAGLAWIAAGFGTRNRPR